MQQTLFGWEPRPVPVDYMIAVYPNGEIAGEVTAFKQQIAGLVGAYPGLDHTPYLALMAFSIQSDAEEELVRKLDDFCFKRLRSANVELAGFYPSDETGSILIEPRQVTFISSLVRKISGVIKPVGNSKMKSLKHPGALVIASGLSSDQYKRVWAVFSNKIYARICFANNLVLLKETGENRQPVTIKSFSLL